MTRAALTTIGGVLLCLSLAPSVARAQTLSPAQYMAEARGLYSSGQYFKAARYAFAAQEKDPRLAAEAYSWATLSLARAHLYNASSYFFIRTLQSGNKVAIRRVLTLTEELLLRVGADVLRNYLIRHTAYADYDLANRGAYLYSLGKNALLAGKEEKAIGYLNGISRKSPLWPSALHLRGTAFAISGKNDAAVQDFKDCVGSASQGVTAESEESGLRKAQAEEAEDLASRCQAGIGRTLYQADQFAEADRAYDGVPKESLVWPDILFEQAWNAFGREEYNRSLGKLVSYKSPALSFVFNPEVDVLRAQSYLALCLYTDASDAVDEFNSKYVKVGEEVKRFVEKNSRNLDAFWIFGKRALSESLYTKEPTLRMANRFVRGPYFQNLVAADRAVQSERLAVRRFASQQPGVSSSTKTGFPGFLGQVLSWREKSIRQLGGGFVKNSLIDYHTSLIADYEKISFIKLEMLRRAKEQLIYKRELGTRVRGNIEPRRRDDQYFWSFNGEFWNDELGDYVFGLETECHS